MGIVKRQSIKASIASYAGIALGAINIIFLFPLLLSPDEIGFVETLRSIAFILAPFAELGLPSFVVKFFPYYNNLEKKHSGFFSFILLIFIISFIFICLLVFIFDDYILNSFRAGAPELVEYFWYIIPLTFYIALFSIISAYSTSHMRIVVPGILQNVVLRVLILLSIMAYYFELVNFEQFIFLFINIYALPIVLMLFYIKYLKRLFLNINFSLFNKTNFKLLGSFGFFVVFSAASGMLVNKIDIVMLSSLSGLEQTGIYTIAFFIGSVIEIPRRNITSIAYPILTSSFKENNIDQIDELYKKTSITQLVIGVFLFLGIWLNIDSIFQFIPNSEIYIAGKYVVLFIGMGKVFDMLMGCNNEIVIASIYYRFNLYSNVFLAALTIGTNFIFIPIYGITGAAMASALSIFIFNFINYTYVRWRFKIQPFSFATLKGILIGLFVFFIVEFIPELDNLYLDIILRSVMITILFVPLIYFFKVSEDINKTIENIFLKIKNTLSK